MKKLLLFPVLLSLWFGSASAQLSSAITSQIHDPSFSTGRDFWLALPSNAWDTNYGGKYNRIFISATQNTTAWVEYEGERDSIPVYAYKTSQYIFPLTLEMESSGYVENKGIHIYSKDANLSVYYLSHQPYSSDGSYIIPTIGWGTDYIVAAYGSAFTSGANLPNDLPSECIIVAEEDSTSVTITPSCDCRQDRSGNINGDAASIVVVFPQGQPATFPLNRGQSLQLMPVKAQDPDNYDMTGSIIHSNHPIGVIGASMQPQIPAEDPYGDFVCEMIPPIRTWGEAYYATNPQQPEGSTDDFARYLFIGSVPGQEIDRYDYETGSHVECIVPNQYGVVWDELELGQRFTSAEPFLCVSYINSSTFPDGANSNGDPAECIIPPKEQFRTSLVFQTPQSVGNLVPYDNYVSLICRDSDAKYTLFDGKSILGLGTQPVDGTFEIFTVPHVAPGVHTAVQDLVKDTTAAGVGVYLYGYGFDETYAWSSPSGAGTFHSRDSVPPVANMSMACYQGIVSVTDSGNLPDSLGTQSGLAAIWPDTNYNMTFQPDSDWVEGSGADTSGFTVSVIDPKEPGIITVEVYDLAGNLTTFTTTYKAFYPEIEPPIQNLGVWQIGTPANIAYDTLFNLGQDTITLTELRLKYGNVGFSIYDSVGGPVDLSPLLPGRYRLIQIQFGAQKATAVTDSIIYGNTCELQAVAVIGSGGAADFAVTSQTWSDEPLEPGMCYPKTVTIENLSRSPITIDSVWWADKIHFQMVSTFVVTVPPSPGSVSFTIDYCPDSNSLLHPDRTQASWFSPQVLKSDGSGAQDPRFDSLIGWATAPLGVDGENIPSLNATIIPIEGGRSLEIVLPESIDVPIHFELVNVLGESVQQTVLGTGTQTLDESALPRGVYFYRLTSGTLSQNGKVILGQ